MAFHFHTMSGKMRSQSTQQNITSSGMLARTTTSCMILTTHPTTTMSIMWRDALPTMNMKIMSTRMKLIRTPTISTLTTTTSTTMSTTSTICPIQRLTTGIRQTDRWKIVMITSTITLSMMMTMRSLTLYLAENTTATTIMLMAMATRLMTITEITDITQTMMKIMKWR